VNLLKDVFWSQETETERFIGGIKEGFIGGAPSSAAQDLLRQKR
jgi:hypothetical protein